jgi:hypothetical protein
MKKVQRLLPSSKGTNDSQSQLESSFDYQEKTNIDDGLVDSHENFNPNEFEEEIIFNTDEVGGGLKDDNASEIDDELEESSIFNESPSEDFVGKFEGVPVFDEFPKERESSCNEEYGYDGVPIFDEFPREELGEFEDGFEDFSIFGGDYEDLPVYDECSNEDMDCNNEEEGFQDIGGSHEEQEMSSLRMYEPCISWEDSEQVLDESYEMKIVDCDFEIEDDAQHYENDLDTPQLDEVLVEDGSEVLPPEFALDVQVCIALVPNVVQELPKRGKEYLGQLIDPLGMVFNQASFKYNVELSSLNSTTSCLGDALGVCVECYFGDIVVHKGQAKWVTYLHTSMDAVNVHKMKLVLKMGYCMRMTWIKKCSHVPTLDLHNKYFYGSMFSLFSCLSLVVQLEDKLFSF